MLPLQAPFKFVTPDSQACGALESITCGFDALGTRRQRASDSAAIEALIGAIRKNRDNSSLLTEACCALRNICSGDDELASVRRLRAYMCGAHIAILAAVQACEGEHADRTFLVIDLSIRETIESISQTQTPGLDMDELAAGASAFWPRPNPVDTPPLSP